MFKKPNYSSQSLFVKPKTPFVFPAAQPAPASNEPLIDALPPVKPLPAPVPDENTTPESKNIYEFIMSQKAIEDLSPESPVIQQLDALDAEVEAEVEAEVGDAKDDGCCYLIDPKNIFPEPGTVIPTRTVIVRDEFQREHQVTLPGYTVGDSSLGAMMKRFVEMDALGITSQQIDERMYDLSTGLPKTDDRLGVIDQLIEEAKTERIEEKKEEEEKKVVNTTPEVQEDDSQKFRVVPLKHYLNTRVVQTASKLKVCRPFSGALVQFIDNCVFGHNIPQDKITLDLVSIAHGKSVGLWEEGGAYNSVGRALLILSPEGEKLAPTSVFHNPNIVNGRHALVAVWPGCFVILAGSSKDHATVALYRIAGMAGFSAKTSAASICQANLCAVLSVTEFDKEPVKQLTHITHDNISSGWDAEHPAFTAALRQCANNLAITPGYVLDYRVQHIDNSIRQDVNSCFHDIEQGSATTYTSLRKAYNALNNAVCKVVSDIADQQQFRSYHAYTYVYLYYDIQTRSICVILTVVKYNTALGSSAEKGNRLWYGRVILQPGEMFWYPDQTPDQAQEYNAIFQSLTSAAYHGRALIVLRRMTRNRHN